MVSHHKKNIIIVPKTRIFKNQAIKRKEGQRTNVKNHDPDIDIEHEIFFKQQDIFRLDLFKEF